jgi:hypothetical protein
MRVLYVWNTVKASMVKKVKLNSWKLIVKLIVLRYKKYLRGCKKATKGKQQKYKFTNNLFKR